MIFQQTEKINIRLDSSVEEIKTHCEAICSGSDFEPNYFQLSNKHYFSIEHKDNIQRINKISVRLPHLKAVIKKEQENKMAEVEFTHSYVDLIGIVLIALTILILTILFYDQMDRSWIIYTSLVIPIVGLYVYMRLDKLKNEKSQLRQIIADIEESSITGKNYNTSKK